MDALTTSTLFGNARKRRGEGERGRGGERERGRDMAC